MLLFKESNKSFKLFGDLLRTITKYNFKVGPTALFGNFKLTPGSGKHYEDFSHAHIVSLLYKIITSATDADNLAVGFDRSSDRKQHE